MSLARLTRERKQLLEAHQRGEVTPSSSANTTAASVSTLHPAQSRIRADLQALVGLSSEVKPDPMDWYVIHLTHRPTRGPWSGGTFQFRLIFPNEFPYSGPKVRYIGPRRILHPNIEGDVDKKDWGVCLGLQTEWVPTCTIKDMVVAIEMLFVFPNYDNPLPGVAQTAAQLLKNDPKKFEQTARQWMQGNYTI